MNPQTTSALKSAADREGALLRHLALCRELQEAADRLPGEREALEKALKRARLLTLHYAGTFCDAFDSDIAPRLGIAPP